MNRLRVLMYHKVSDREKDYLTVTGVQLEQQLTWLKDRYTFITLAQLTEHVTGGIALPPNPLLITFDDGYENNFTLAYPIFKKFNLPFSIFLVSSFIGKEVKYDGQAQKFLNIEQLKKMQDIVQYGFHSDAHLNLMDIPADKRGEEIQKGITSLRDLPLSIQNAWAYTYGAYPKKDKAAYRELQSAFRDAGIQCAFRIGNRINPLPLQQPYAIQRIDIRGNHSFLRFKWKVMAGNLF